MKIFRQYSIDLNSGTTIDWDVSLQVDYFIIQFKIMLKDQLENKTDQKMH